MGSKPRELSADEHALTASGAAGTASVPTAQPPAQAGGAGGVTAWQGDKRVGALFSISENRNSWVMIQDIGWRKLANNSDSAIVALNLFAAHAKQTQCRFDYREEADGMIHEVYIW